MNTNEIIFNYEAPKNLFNSEENQEIFEGNEEVVYEMNQKFENE